jgi:type I restriction enzyme R subunit
MDEDPALYKKLSEMVQEAIASFREERIDEMEYFNRVRDLEEQLEDGVSAGMPRRLEGRPAARAYYGIIDGRVGDDGTENELPDLSQEQLANAGIRIEEIIDKHKVVDWTRNPDVEKRMRNEVEDYLYFELGFPLDSIQEVLDRVIQVARSRD